MVLFLPETSSSNILLRRARRLRKLTGDDRLKAQSEIDQANLTPRDVAYEALVRPAQLIFMDPAIGFTAGYVALCYGIYYSFFEAFPLVYIDLYGFNVGEMGLTFLSITVGVIISIIVYYAYIWYVVEPSIRKKRSWRTRGKISTGYFLFLLPAHWPFLIWLDWKWRCLLDSECGWHYVVHDRRVHSDAMHLRLSAVRVPTVRCFALCRQRCCPLLRSICSRHVWK